MGLRQPTGSMRPLTPMRSKTSALASRAGVLARLAAVILCAAMALALAGCQQEQRADVVVGAPDEDDPPLLMSLPSMIDVGRTTWLELPATCDPATIEVGIPCGMLEMCGQDPCLCGAVDDYGACACNGKQWVTPTFTLTFEEEGIVTTAEAFGKTYLVPLKSGTVNAVVHAELPHHQPSEAHVQIHVKGWEFVDIAKVAGAVLLVAAVLAGLAFGVRAIVRAGRRASGRRREKRAKRQAEAEQEAERLAKAPAPERILHGSSLLKRGRKGGGKGLPEEREGQKGSPPRPGKQAGPGKGQGKKRR